MEEITSEQKKVFSRVANFSKGTSFVYNNNKIISDGKTYTRNLDNEWKLVPSQDSYDEDIGFVTYEKYALLKNKVKKLDQDLKNKDKIFEQKIKMLKKGKKRNVNPKALLQQKKYIEKVMKLISQMRTLSPNEKMENTAKKQVAWIEKNDERKNLLREIYKTSLSTTENTKGEVYTNLKLLSIWSSEYDKRFKKEEKNYSQFQLDMKSVMEKEWGDVTKYLTKVNFFGRLFKYLPPGAWALCEIPTTYWTLIHREYWETIIDCTKNKSAFPFDQFELSEDFERLYINEEEVRSFEEGDTSNEDEEDEVEYEEED